MSNLLKRCVEHFKTDDLYSVLGVGKEASKKEIKKAYHKRSLACHPDRAQDEEKVNATQKFQVLSQVHSILSDDGRRAEYDETGQVDEELALDQDRDWEDYWRLLFPKITTEDIQTFTDKYKGSEEELVDLKAVYIASKGDMNDIMNDMLCCEHEDEPRFHKILQDLIEKGDIPEFEAFINESEKKRKSRHKKAKKEAAEAAQQAKGRESEGDLFALIASRQSSRAQQADNFFAKLEAKYGGDSGDSRGRKRKKK